MLIGTLTLIFSVLALLIISIKCSKHKKNKFILSFSSFLPQSWESHFDDAITYVESAKANHSRPSWLINFHDERTINFINSTLQLLSIRGLSVNKSQEETLKNDILSYASAMEMCHGDKNTQLRFSASCLEILMKKSGVKIFGKFKKGKVLKNFILFNSDDQLPYWWDYSCYNALTYLEKSLKNNETPTWYWKNRTYKESFCENVQKALINNDLGIAKTIVTRKLFDEYSLNFAKSVEVSGGDLTLQLQFTVLLHKRLLQSIGAEAYD